ncbi:uncharacterized protein LOC128220311 [Mya arenaria]|uniref:uncharacterized protein LOC128220311 n=1 Tax=Mya arenaria TaxID=6604 RepID=UPI0022E6C5AB|nr:uncharacterized protein LOC128220311 [Mya arenaria]XP_052784625.1 uncharacterized protein LOC128220311 [Mya arenaria]
MGVKINGEAENSFRCVYQTLEGKFECTGRRSKCSDNGDLELTFVDANNGVVHSEKIKITVAERHLSLAINQTFPKTAQGDASTFHMYCGVEAACDNYTMEIATGDTKIINIPGRSEVSCGKTKRTNDGDYDIQCNATVNGEMLLSQEFFNTSCSLRRSNQTIAQSESFEMPFCHDLSSSCSCKGANNSCASICNVAGKCLLEAGYQSFNASVTGCDTRCMLKWCLREHNSTIVATQENIIFEICELVGDCSETGLC